MASHRRRPRAPARRPGRRTPQRRIFIVCEGRRTEPDYLHGYRRHVRNPSVEIVMSNQQGEPRRLVQLAIQARRRARRKARQEQDPFLAYDEVWCVFDRDDHAWYHEACDTAQSQGIRLALSIPCFELWLLLHLDDPPRRAIHHTDMPWILREYLPGYGKRVDFREFAPGVEDAIRRADALNALARKEGDPHRNPNTTVQGLLRAMGGEHTPA